MHYQLFLPGKSVFDPRDLAAAGLADLVRPEDRQPVTFPLTGPGPGGNVGIVLNWGTPRPGYFPESQEWHELPGGVWIGWEREHPPTPDDLDRAPDRTVQGAPTRLGDGREWVVPNVVNIPCAFGLGPGGTVSRKPLARYAEFRELGTEVFAALEANETGRQELQIEPALDLGARLLAVNYRIARPLCLLWELFDQTNLGRVLNRSIELHKLIEIVDEHRKKKAAADAAAAAPST